MGSGVRLSLVEVLFFKVHGLSIPQTALVSRPQAPRIPTNSHILSCQIKCWTAKCSLRPRSFPVVKLTSVEDWGIVTPTMDPVAQDIPPDSSFHIVACFGTSLWYSPLPGSLAWSAFCGGWCSDPRQGHLHLLWSCEGIAGPTDLQVWGDHWSSASLSQRWLSNNHIAWFIWLACSHIYLYELHQLQLQSWEFIWNLLELGFIVLTSFSMICVSIFAASRRHDLWGVLQTSQGHWLEHEHGRRCTAQLCRLPQRPSELNCQMYPEKYVQIYDTSLTMILAEPIAESMAASQQYDAQTVSSVIKPHKITHSQTLKKKKTSTKTIHDPPNP